MSTINDNIISISSGNQQFYPNYAEANTEDNPSVNLALGSLCYAFKDLSTGYGNFEISLSHVFNSGINSAFNSLICGVGTGWKLNLHQALVQQNTDTVLYLDEAGETHKFVRFDGNRFYDSQNAKTVLYYSSTDKYISDGVGNKWYFNSNGLLERMVSCFNNAIEKVLTYDQDNRLLQIHDTRSDTGSNVRNKIVFTYENGLLQKAISYVNFTTKQFELHYSYENGHLMGVDKVGDQTERILNFEYLSDKLSSVRNLQGGTCKISYDSSGKVSCVRSGITSGDTFTEKSLNSYVYNCTDSVSYETHVTNKNGITLAHFLNRKGHPVSKFEKTSSGLKTLQKQGNKKTGFSGTTTPSINGIGSASVGSTWTVPIPENFSVARNVSEESLHTFEYAFWLKHSCNCERMYAKFNYKVNGTTYSDKVYVDGKAQNAWQRVSLPLEFPLDEDDKPILTLSSLSVSFETTSTLGDVFVNEIGFAPAPKNSFEIVSDNSTYDFSEFDRVFVDVSTMITANNGTTDTYITENDLIATQTNYYVNADENGNVESFDMIYCNGTKRKSVHSLQIGKNGSWLVTLPATLQTKTSTGVPGSSIYGIYSFEDRILTVTTNGVLTANGQTISSSSKDRTHFNGNKHSTTDEYGVTTNYYYDDFGNLTLMQTKDCSDVVVSSKAFYYDDQNRPTYQGNDTAGINLGYNSTDMPAWQAETLGGSSTGHSFENAYSVYPDRLTNVKEKTSSGTVAQNTVTYQNGLVRTVSDGTVKYGIIDDVANDKVTYTVFEGTSDTATERKVQEDSVSDYSENDDEIVVQTHTRKIFNSSENVVATTATDIDVYGRVQTTYQSGSTGGKVQYAYNDCSESAFASTLHQKFLPNGDYTEYSYDDDGNLTGWAEKKSLLNGGGTTFEVKQVAHDMTKYTFGSNSWYVRQRLDETKTLSPRLKATEFCRLPSDYEGAVASRRTYSYDDIGNLTCKKENSLRSDTYTHENIGGDFFLKTSTTQYTNNINYGYKGTTTATRNQDGSIKKLVNSWTSGTYVGTPATSGSSTRTFTYDTAHRLTQETNSALGITKTYSYKTDGRIDKIVDSAKGTLQFYYDNKGRLQSVNNTTTYTYDLFGNRTKKVTLDKTHNYAYNASGQLRSVDLGTSNVTYKYNADGARCSKTVDGVTTEYYLDGDKILGEKNDSTTTYYIYDAFGLDKLMSGSYICKYVRDQFGNVIALLNNAGSVVASYEYDVFGNCKVFDAYGQEITSSSHIGNINPYRWKSFYFDTETGLYYANGSYYDPEVGQYLDSAPIETVTDNAFSVGNLDRNAPVCDNILELEGNPYTLETTKELSADGTYNLDDDIPWWYKVEHAVQEIAKAFNKLKWWVKLLIGVGFLAFAIFFTAISHGSIVPLFIELAIGIGVTVAGYLVSSLINGEFDWEDFANTVATAFLLTSVTLFVSSGVSAIKYTFRDKTLAPYELDPRSIKLAKKGNPSYETFRKRVWQNEAKFRPEIYEENVSIMLKGQAPLVNGKPMHLHHIYGKSRNLYKVIKVTPSQHTAIHKAIGYHVTKPKLRWSLKNAIIFGGLV